jgi:hypothetical protein
MVVEEALKSATTEEESNTNINMIANPNPNPRAGGAGEEDEEPEEGEIVGEDEDSKQTGTEVVHQSHPLEHSWTFWFDNPAAKSKQAAWGSSLRPIYTFSTVEEFWRLNVCFFFFLLYYTICLCIGFLFLVGLCLSAEEVEDLDFGEEMENLRGKEGKWKEKLATSCC